MRFGRCWNGHFEHMMWTEWSRLIWHMDRNFWIMLKSSWAIFIRKRNAIENARSIWYIRRISYLVRHCERKTGVNFVRKTSVRSSLRCWAAIDWRWCSAGDKSHTRLRRLITMRLGGSWRRCIPPRRLCDSVRSGSIRRLLLRDSRLIGLMEQP